MPETEPPYAACSVASWWSWRWQAAGRRSCRVCDCGEHTIIDRVARAADESDQGALTT